MHKTTFNAMDRHGDFHGRIVTVWDGGPAHGKVGKIANLIQPRTVVINLDDGTRVEADHRKVALGDNSRFASEQ